MKIAQHIVYRGKIAHQKKIVKVGFISVDWGRRDEKGQANAKDTMFHVSHFGAPLGRNLGKNLQLLGCLVLAPNASVLPIKPKTIFPLWDKILEICIVLNAHYHAHFICVRLTHIFTSDTFASGGQLMNSQLRKPTNLSMDASLLTEAKALKVNLSRAAEEGIRHAVATAKADQWKTENASALRSSNSYVEKHGLPLDEYRKF